MFDFCDVTCFCWKETEQMSVAAAVKALEERQERILMHLHQLQVKMQKMVNEADLLHSVPQTACVSSFLFLY